MTSETLLAPCETAARERKQEGASDSTRRAFLRTLAIGGIATLTAELWMWWRPRTVTAIAPFALPGAAELAPGNAMEFSVPGSHVDGLLVRLAQGGFVAVDRSCPHLGCPVMWSREKHEFQCPCHAAAFEAESGRVITGPPRRGLSALATRVKGSDVWISQQQNEGVKG